MIQPDGFIFKCDDGKKRKNNQRDNFLYDFQLPEIERTSVAIKPHAVSRNLKKVFKQSDSPANEDDNN